jgi:hypothetical protein
MIPGGGSPLSGQAVSPRIALPFIVAGVFIAASIAGCDRGKNKLSRESLRDSAGISIVEIDQDPGSRVARWELTHRVTQRGTAEVPFETIARVSGAARCPSGVVVIADSKSRHLVLMDSSGTLIRVISRPGRGPTELSWPSGLWCTAGDTVFVVDQNAPTPEIVVFSIDGTFLRRRLAESPPEYLGGMSPSTITVDGQGAWSVFTKTPREIRFCRTSADGRVVGRATPLLQWIVLDDPMVNPGGSTLPRVLRNRCCSPRQRVVTFSASTRPAPSAGSSV